MKYGIDWTWVSTRKVSCRHFNIKNQLLQDSARYTIFMYILQVPTPCVSCQKYFTTIHTKQQNKCTDFKLSNNLKKMCITLLPFSFIKGLFLLSRLFSRFFNFRLEMELAFIASLYSEDYFSCTTTHVLLVL